MYWLPVYLLMLGGCSEPPPTYHVTGQVLVNGEPTEGVYVALYRSGVEADGISKSARTATNGTFAIDTSSAGQHAVTVFWPSELVDDGAVLEGPDRFGGQYRSPHQPMTTIDVHEGDNQLAPLELVLD